MVSADARAQAPASSRGPTTAYGTTRTGRSAPATTQAKRVPGPVANMPPPRDLNDLPAWLEYRARNHLAGLPLEARLFYRRGLLLAQSGSRDDATCLVRGAAELDPTFSATPSTSRSNRSSLRSSRQGSSCWVCATVSCGTR